MEIKNQMSADEFNALFKHGALKVGKKGKVVQQELTPEFEKMIKENKFNAKKTEFEGKLYDSKKEANFAIELKANSEVKKIETQVRYDVTVKDTFICYYVLDFKVEYNDGSFRYFDVKGYKKGAAYQIFKIKKRLVQAIHKITIEEI